MGASAVARASVVRHLALGSLLVLLLAIPLALATAPASAAPPAQAPAGITYRLVDTWANEPWTLTPGRIGTAIDVSSAPDGTIYVLDGQNRAVHVLAPDGAPQRVFPVPDAWLDQNDWVPRRLDVGFDGRLHLLVVGTRTGDGLIGARVDRLRPDGSLEHRITLSSLGGGFQSYLDLAVRSDGRIYLSRMGRQSVYVEWPVPTPTPAPGERPETAVEVYDAEGTWLASLAPPELRVPGNLDVDRDGTLYVINRVPSPSGDQPRPGPTATPLPSLLAAPWPAQAGSPIEGVLVFWPDHRVRETVPFSGAEDIAAGPAGVFLSRNVELFGLRESAPLYGGPGARVYGGAFSRVAYNLDVSADGRLLAAMNHCYFQGLVIIDDPAARPATGRLVGANDNPFLEGPPFPLRLAAGEAVAILQGRFTGRGLPPDRTYTATTSGSGQAVQRWTRQGERTAASPLRGQLGVCAGNQTWWTRDVAIDGRDIYTVDPNVVQLRPDDGLPRWSAFPALDLDPEARPLLSAISARGGRAAVLDTANAHVYLLDRTGRTVDHWPSAVGDANALPTDIALDGDRIYLADAGRARVTVHALDGTPLDEWPTYDGPASIAVGPTGDVFLLGRGGWGYRHAPDGTPRAFWAMPKSDASPLDLTVDVDGRVYVSHARFASSAGVPLVRIGSEFRVDQAGVWVFEAAAAAPVPPAEPAGCVAWPDKWATPRRIPLGDQVDVVLTVQGRCPGSYDPVQIAVVLDTSRSMNFDQSFDRAREALATLLGRLDPRAAEVALVTFDDGASLVAPLSRDLAAVARLVVARGAWGDTRLTAALELARQELLSARGNPAARRLVLLVTDGAFHDTPEDAVAALEADALDLYALVLSNSETRNEERDRLEVLIPADDHRYMNPGPNDLRVLVDALVHYRDQLGLFRTLTVEDEVPANMRYVAGSAVPAATWDAARRTLTWTLDSIAAARPVTLRYRLEPLEVGTWPTNVQAVARYRDVLGRDGDLVFPVPEVEVYGPTPPVEHLAWLPFGAARSCFRTARPLDVVLVMDTSSSMAEPAPGGGTKLDAARRAASDLLALLRWPGDHGAVVSFDVGARRHSGLVGDPVALRAALAGMTTSIGTHIDLGLAEARAVLADGGRATASPVVILLSDGLNNAGPEPVLAAAAPLKAAGAVVYTIGLGAEVDADLLRQVATTRDRYVYAPAAEDLLRIYRQLVSRLACDAR